MSRRKQLKPKTLKINTEINETDWCIAQNQSQNSDEKHQVDENNNMDDDAPASNEYYDYSEASNDENDEKKRHKNRATESSAAATSSQNHAAYDDKIDTASMLNDEADIETISSLSTISSSTLLSPISTPHHSNNNHKSSSGSNLPKIGSYSPVSENSDDDILLKDSYEAGENQVTISNSSSRSTSRSASTSSIRSASNSKHHNYMDDPMYLSSLQLNYDINNASSGALSQSYTSENSMMYNGTENGGNNSSFLSHTMPQMRTMFNCKICGKPFKHRRSLNRHVKLHTGEKHFKCDYCDTAFARSDHLKAHIRTHNNSKPFKCSICQCGYSTLPALKVHIAHHHHTKSKHKCLNCCKEFETKASLDEHIYQAHDIDNTKIENTITNDDQNEVVKSSDSDENNKTTAALNDDTKLATENGDGDDDSDEHIVVDDNNNDIVVETVKESTEINEEVVEKVIEEDDEEEIKQIEPEIASTKTPQSQLSPKIVPISIVTSNNSPKNRETNIISTASLINQPQIKRPRLMESPLQSTPYQPIVPKIAANQPPPPALLIPQAPPQLIKQSYHHYNQQFYSPGNHHHQQQQQYKPKNYCEICNAHFPSIETFYAHMKGHNASSIFYENIITKPQHPPLIPPLIQHQSSDQQSRSYLSNIPRPRNSASVESASAPTAKSTSPKQIIDENTYLMREYCHKESQYWCSECNLSFTRATDHIDHMKREHCLELHRCLLCKDTNGNSSTQLFNDLNLLKQHFIYVHGSKQSDTYRCKHCNSLYKRLSDFITHVKSVHESKQPQQPAQAQQKHIMAPPPAKITSPGTMLNQPKLKCAFCNELFTKESEFHQHLQEHEKPLFKCPYCTFSFINQSFLDHHIESTHHKAHPQMAPKTTLLIPNNFGPKKPELAAMIPKAPQQSSAPQIHSCNICEAKFAKEDQLVLHKYSDHKIIPDQSFLARLQQQAFAAAQQQQQQQQQIAKCSFCHQTFANKQLLEKHVRAMHSFDQMALRNIVAPPALICTFCKHPVSDIASFDDHFNKHNINTPFKSCIICRQVVKSDADLAAHVNAHLKGRQMVPEHNMSAYGSQDVFSCSLCHRVVRASFNELEIQFDHASQQFYRLCKPCAGKNKHAKPLGDASELLGDFYYSNINQQARAVAEETQRHDSSRVKCEKCGVKFESWSEMAAHMETHKNMTVKSTENNSMQKIFTCIKCQQAFASEAEIHEHVQSHLNENARHHETCALCNSVFYTPAQLHSHILSAHEFPSGDFTCPYCNECFAKAETLFSHVLGHGSAAKSFKCHECEQSFAFKSQLANHVHSHKPEAAARLGGYRRSEEQQQKLKREKERMEKEPGEVQSGDDSITMRSNEISASTSAFTPYSKSILANSSEYGSSDVADSDANGGEMGAVATNSNAVGRKRSAEVKQRIQNYNDSANQNQKLNLFNHQIQKDMENNEFKCVLCDQVFPSQQSLQEHFVSIHANESESEETDPSKNSKDVDMKTSELIEAVSLNNSKYKKCAKILPSTDNLTNKSNTKTENKNSGFKIVRKYFYSCHKCNLDFNSLKAYQAHLLTHGKTPDTNICCHICGKAFANTRNLNVHLRLHTGFKPFECEMCKRKFTRKENLRSHMKCHLGIRPFLCPICSKSFGRKSHVITHLEVHLKSKVHKCNQCSLQFESLPAFIKHMITHKSNDNQIGSKGDSKTSSVNANDEESTHEEGEVVNGAHSTYQTSPSKAKQLANKKLQELIEKDSNHNYEELMNLCQEYVELE